MMPSRSLSCAALFAIAAPAFAQGGLPPVPVPPQNPITQQKAVLGKILFFEEQMSSSNRVACGTCHRPGFGGGDPRRGVNPGPDGIQPSPDDTFGSPGVVHSDAQNRYAPSTPFGFAPQVGNRTAPTNLTGAWFPELFWDGRAGGQFVDPQTNNVSIPAGGALEQQSIEPPRNAAEMAHEQRNWNQVAQKLAQSRPMALATNLPPDVSAAIAASPTYPQLFQLAFGSAAITAERIAFALATYQRTLVPDQTPWDQFQRNVPNAMTPQQVQGMNLFHGPARCNLCHVPGLFSDRQFRNLGLRRTQDDLGRQLVTNNPADRAKFKVPSLRNVGLRASFMHTGQFTQLPQVLGFYNAGGGPNLDNKDPLLRPLGLNPQQQQALGDFVANALTDPRVRSELPPFDRPTLFSERTPPNGLVFGLGSAGTGLRVPQLLSEVPANLGNPEFKLGVANARGGSLAVLVLALQRAPTGANYQGVPIHVDIWVTATMVPTLLQGSLGASGAGYGGINARVPSDPALLGASLFGQWVVFDPVALPGIAVTAGVELPIF